MNNPIQTYQPSIDRALRSRVKLFGNLLGQILRTQAGEQVYSAVEELRKGFISLREQDDPDKRAELMQFIAQLDPETLGAVVRAFSTYFALVNVAEEAFQHRQRRVQVTTGKPLWEGSFDDTLREFHEQGVSADDLQILLDEMVYMPVFTAHPTEAKRRTILQALRRIFLTSQELNNTRLSHYQREEITAQLEAQIQILWKTDEVRLTKPTVEAEVRNGLYYFRESLFEAVPETYRNLERAVRRNYEDEGGPDRIRVPSFLRFGSWIGGDRDGNPYVTPEVTRTALRMQAGTVLREYIRRTQELSNYLTQSINLVSPSTPFILSLEQDRPVAQYAFRDEVRSFAKEPYRRKLLIMCYRLRCNLARMGEHGAEPAGQVLEIAYPSAQAYLGDLVVIRDSLGSHGDAGLASGQLNDLIRLVETFGFHLAHLDLREESSRHTQAVTDIVRQVKGQDYAALNEDERLAILGEMLSVPGGIDLAEAALSDASRKILQVFHVMVEMRATISEHAFGNYVISMTHSASHVLEVMLLASAAGLAGKDGEDRWYCSIHTSPLFETIEDLAHIETVLEKLLSHGVYRSLLQVSDNRQEIMLGYSDSCKDGGILASVWNLHEAQSKINDIMRRHEIRYVLFHGRGGTIGRGGGPTHHSIIAQPTGTVHGRIKLTEQGEVLSYKYSNTETATYELTMGATGLLKASAHLVQGVRENRKDHLGVMDQLAELGEQHYRELTDRTEGLLDYFYEVTPVAEIGELNIGSRPSHRQQSDRSKDSIRAIPWVFGWSLSRHALPAWYGIGYALETLRNSDSSMLTRFQRMYHKWTFFRSLIDNTQMALAKADLDIAGEYLRLSTNPEQAQTIYGLIRAEYDRTLLQVLNVAGVHTPLQDDPILSLSLVRREPYLDPLNHIQVMLLERHRALPPEAQDEDQFLYPLLRTINAIAAGMRNTG